MMDSNFILLTCEIGDTVNIWLLEKFELIGSEVENKNRKGRLHFFGTKLAYSIYHSSLWHNICIVEKNPLLWK